MVRWAKVSQAKSSSKAEKGEKDGVVDWDGRGEKGLVLVQEGEGN